MTIELHARPTGTARPRPGRSASRQRSRSDDFLVVGIGASAGGLEALYKLFDRLPPDTGMAFVLIQHLDPTHSSMMVGLLAGHTAMQVLEAADGMPVERDNVYVIPPGVYLSIRDRGGLIIVQDPKDAGHDGMPRSAILTDAADPSVSFDGKLLAFVHLNKDGQNDNLWVANSDGTDPHVIF